MFRGKRNLKLEGVNRAWWALSGSKKSTSKRQPCGGKDMEIDSVAGKRGMVHHSSAKGALRRASRRGLEKPPAWEGGEG